MEKSNRILKNREEKNHFIQKYINDFQVISLKANIPGPNKQTKEAYILTAYFDQILEKQGYKKSQILDGDDGPMYIYLTLKTKNIKEQMIKIEEDTILGRFVDIDVFNSSISLSRNNLRKCYICDNPAFVCARNMSHSIPELTNYISKKVENYLCEIVKLLCDEVIMEELNIHPKFGLVTPYSNGSHKDMNYNLMITAKDAIINYFVEMFLIGYNEDNLREIFDKIRMIGQKAEQIMFISTKGINAYKGLIFDLGLMVASIGYKLSHLNIQNDIFDNIKEMTKGITKELDNGNETFGKIAYQTYRIGGARLEAERGFPNVQNLLKKDLNNIEALCYLISEIDDTVLLKRCGNIQKYFDIKEEFKKIDISKIDQMTSKCINENISFGGAADLLIVYLFIIKFNQFINIY